MSRSEDMDRAQADARDVKALLAVEEGLSEWEVSFAESLGRQVCGDRRPLTARQREVLDRILTRLDR